MLKRLLLTACVVLAGVASAWAQPIAAGNLAAAQESVSAILGSSRGSVSVQVSGTFVGTITFEGTADGANYVSILAASVTTGSSATTTTSTGVFSVGNAGYLTIRARASAWTSGTASIAITAGSQGGGGGGGGGGGAVTQGTVPWIVAGGATYGTAGTTPINTQICDTDSCAQVTAGGAVLVSGILATNTSAAAANRMPTLPAIVETGNLPSLADGRDSALYVDGSGKLFVVGPFASDSQTAAANRINVIPAIVQNSAPSLTDGRDAALSVTTGGAARVMITNAAGTATTIATDQTFGTSTYTETTTTGPLAGMVRTDTPAALANTTNEIAPLSGSALGGLYVASASDPCSRLEKTYYVVNLTAAATVEIADPVANRFYHICSVNLVAAGANVVLIASDDSDNCGSLTAGLNGGTTAATGWSFAANGGIALGNGEGTVMKTATANHALCIAPSTTAQLSGTIAYVGFP